MSWTDAVAGASITSAPSPLDSSRFGLTIARVTVPDLMTAVSVRHVVDALDEHAAELCVVRYPARHTTWFSELKSAGYDLIWADTLVYWRLTVGLGRRPEERDAITRNFGTPSGHLVDSIVKETFRGYPNHYSANPRLAPELALAGYSEWARGASRTGDSVLLLSELTPVGLATCSIQEEVQEILLAGIVPDHQGRGLYPHLLAAVEDRCADLGATTLVISTQGHNVGVQRLWARYGFEPAASLVTVHAAPRGS